jgi:tetratricopeptide (TPR) repeat protein
MPSSSQTSQTTPHRDAHLAILFSCLMVTSGLGCRALRCPGSADASLAAARQTSLQALEAQQGGQWEQAEALFASAVEQCPNDERARHGYAQSLWQRGAQDQAVAQMEEAVRLSGSDPERRVELGRMYLHRGELRRAGQQADYAIAANSQLAAAWALRGQVQQASGQREEALASLHRALGHRDSYPEVQLAIAAIYAEQNRPQRALATLQTLADSYPPGAVPNEVLIPEAFACRALGRYQDAADRLVQVCERGGASAEVHFELARTQLLAGNSAAARQAAQAALTRDPHHAGSQALALELGTGEGVIASASASRPTTVH